MTTGADWDVTDPRKPWMYFDPNGKLDIPWDWVTWLAAEGTTYASHTFTAEDGMDVVSSANSGGVITARLAAETGVGATALVAGRKYGVTCRITDSDGQIWDQTLYFKIKEL